MVELIITAMVLGLIPAAVATRRGLDFVTWWLYGMLLWPVAVVHVFFATPDSVMIAAQMRPRLCPFCAESIRPAAKVCKHCGRDVARARFIA